MSRLQIPPLLGSSFSATSLAWARCTSSCTLKRGARGGLACNWILNPLLLLPDPTPHLPLLTWLRILLGRWEIAPRCAVEASVSISRGAAKDLCIYCIYPHRLTLSSRRSFPSPVGQAPIVVHTHSHYRRDVP
jgi:hypothetical protein